MPKEILLSRNNAEKDDRTTSATRLSAVVIFGVYLSA
jgi:hypothetical protein